MIPQLGCGNSRCWKGYQTGMGAMKFVQGITVSRAGDFSEHVKETLTYGVAETMKARRNQMETNLLIDNIIYTRKC